MELLDGDACEVNEAWIKDVLDSANTLIEKQLGREAKVIFCENELIIDVSLAFVNGAIIHSYVYCRF